MGRVDLVRREAHNFVLGYWLDASYTGHGYATEACTALVEFGRSVLGANDVWAGVTPRGTSRAKACWNGLVSSPLPRWASASVSTGPFHVKRECDNLDLYPAQDAPASWDGVSCRRVRRGPVDGGQASVRYDARWERGPPLDDGSQKPVLPIEDQRTSLGDPQVDGSLQVCTHRSFPLFPERSRGIAEHLVRLTTNQTSPTRHHGRLSCQASVVTGTSSSGRRSVRELESAEGVSTWLARAGIRP